MDSAGSSEAVPRRKQLIPSRRLDLFAGLPVRDFSIARPWYERLLGGPPTFLAHETEAVWEVAPNRYVYVVEVPRRAGRGRTTIFLSELGPYLALVRRRGLEPRSIERLPNGVRKATFRDPDGNELAFGGTVRARSEPRPGRRRSNSVRRSRVR